jgi:HEPN domain-containing protein
MKAITQEWIEKAEGDWATLMREYRARKNPNYDAVCFHAQQCAEKYLKAKLQEAGIHFAKTHNLLNLINDLLPIEPNWIKLHQSLAFLTVYAVKYRYPGDKADKIEAKETVKNCRLVRKTVRQSFSLTID